MEETSKQLAVDQANEALKPIWMSALLGLPACTLLVGAAAGVLPVTIGPTLIGTVGFLLGFGLLSAVVAIGFTAYRMVKALPPDEPHPYLHILTRSWSRIRIQLMVLAFITPIAVFGEAVFNPEFAACINIAGPCVLNAGQLVVLVLESLLGSTWLFGWGAAFAAPEFMLVVLGFKRGGEKE